MSNVELNLGAGGKVARTETKGGFESQVVLLDLGGLGAESLLTGAMPVTGAFWQATQPVSIASAVPVTGTFWQTTQPISGAVTANAGTNLNTSALALETGGNLATVATRTPALGQALAAASVPVVLTAAQLATLTPLTTVAVTGTFWQATQPVSIASAVGVTQSGTWTVQPGNTPNTTPWLANHLDPTATTGSITAADAAIGTATGQGSQSILTGTPTANSSVTTVVNAATTVGVQVTGTWTGTLVFERSIDGGTTYTPASMYLHGVAGPALSSITANGLLHSNCGGTTHFRVRATALASGTATVKFQPGYGASIVASSGLAGANLLGQTSASNETGTVYNGTTALTPKFAAFSTSASGATTVVAAVASKRIRVLGWSCSANGNTNIKWQSHVAGDISGLRYMTQYKDTGGAPAPVGRFQTVAGEALDINNSAAVAISGEVTYIEV